MRVMVVECSEIGHFLIQFQRQIISNKNNKNQTYGLESAITTEQKNKDKRPIGLNGKLSTIAHTQSCEGV